MLFASLGVVVGVYAETWDQAGFVNNIVILPLSFLGGVFYSVDLLPSPWQEISHVNPIFFLINAVRYGFLGHERRAGRGRAGSDGGAGAGLRRVERVDVPLRPAAEGIAAGSEVHAGVRAAPDRPADGAARAPF